MSRDHIRISGLRVDCIVGVYPHERGTPQPLLVDVDLRVDTESAGSSEKLSETVDYAMVATKIAFLLTNCHFRLLETAAHAIAKTLLAPPVEGAPLPRVDALTLRLSKPGSFGSGAMPSVEITRDGSWARLEREVKPFGTVDIVHESRTAGIYRLNVAPGRGIPLHVHRAMQESELVLADGLLCQGRPVAPGTMFRWPKDAPHRYDNPTDQWLSILCVDAPRFIPDDEVPVDAATHALADVAPETPFFVMEREA